MKRELDSLPPLACKLLAAIFRELADLIETDLFDLPHDRHEAGRIRLAVKDATEGIARMNLESWLGHALDDAERRRAHRALDALADAGFIRRIVTETGRTIAVRLIACEANSHHIPS